MSERELDEAVITLQLESHYGIVIIGDDVTSEFTTPDLSYWNHQLKVTKTALVVGVTPMMEGLARIDIATDKYSDDLVQKYHLIWEGRLSLPTHRFRITELTVPGSPIFDLSLDNDHLDLQVYSDDKDDYGGHIYLKIFNVTSTVVNTAWRQKLFTM